MVESLKAGVPCVNYLLTFDSIIILAIEPWLLARRIDRPFVIYIIPSQI